MKYLLCGLLLLAIAGCAPRPPDQQIYPTGPVTAPKNPTVPKTVTAPKNPTAPKTNSATTVQASLTEYAIALKPAQALAGTVTFQAKNDGKELHALEVEGHGISQKTVTLKPGQSATLTIKLKPGVYKADCPVGDHEAEGMKTTFTVK